MEDNVYIKFLENLKEEMTAEMDPIISPLFFQIDEIITNFKTGGLNDLGSYTIIASSKNVRYTTTITLNDIGYNLANMTDIAGKIKSIVFKTERIEQKKS